MFQNTHFSYEIIPFSFKERVEAIDEAKKRFENQIPPGYLDYQTKEKRIDEYNDFFIWKSMLNHAKNNMSSDICYFVTNDKKDCNNEIDKFYLEKEFYEETVQNIKIISSDEFLEEIGYKTIECSEIENEINRKLEEYPNDVLLESSLAGEILKLFDNGMNEIKNIELDKPDIKIICAEIYAMNIYKVNAKIFYGTELSTSEYKNYFKVYLNCEMFYYIDTKAISINIVSYNLDSITEFINEIKFINQRFKVNNKKLFDFVKFRDNYTCQICGRDRLYDNSIILHIHHIIPKNKGGETCAENLTTVCNNCNRKLGDKFHLN